MTATRGENLLRHLRLLMLAVAMLGLSTTATGAVFLSVAIAPPALPVYAQPICPGPGYIWVPGYWGYGPEGYYWVPGTWVISPYVGALWTPGYWGWANGLYVWHAGYWGPTVGFYGGVNYGFGYFGVGYAGGYWREGSFYYNRSVSNVNVNVVRNTYNTTVVNNTNINRVSYNGGAGGINAQPTAAEQAAMRQRHTQATPAQLRHEQASSTNRAMLASVNQGRPSIAATPRAGAFGHANAVAAEGAVARNPGGPGNQGYPGGHPKQHANAGMQPQVQGSPAPGQPQQMHGQGQQHQGQNRAEGQGRGEGQGHGERAGEGHNR
jgi:hypothetical protein